MESVDIYLVSIVIVSPHALFESGLIVLDDDVGGINDRLGRSVVLLQFDHDCFSEVSLEVDDIFDVRSSPTVDTLPIITDDTEVSCFVGQEAYDAVLDFVGILIFIDIEILKFIVEVLENIWKLQDIIGLEKDIVEVECIAGFESSFVFWVDLIDERSKVIVDSGAVAVWIYTAIFGERDLVLHLPVGCVFWVDLFFFDDLFDDSLAIATVIDREIFLISESIDKHSQEKHTHRVKSRNKRKILRSSIEIVVRKHFNAKFFTDTFAHLFGGLVGKCDRKYRAGCDTMILDHCADSFGQCMCLS